MERSTTSEWILLALWVVVLLTTIYALAVGNDALGQWSTYAFLVLATLTLVVQWRLRSQRSPD